MSTAIAPPLARPEDQSVVFAAYSGFGKRLHVCSYHFMAVKEKRDYKTRPDGPYQTTYTLAPVEENTAHPSVLLVMDGLQRVFQGTNEMNYKKNWVDLPESSLNIARDVVKAASGSEPGGPELDAPAVWISRADRLPANEGDWKDWGKPEFAQRFPEFASECNAYKDRQWRYCERKVKEGKEFDTKGMPLQINELHRRAGVWVGANSAEHSWIRMSTFGATMPCPLCGKPTSTTHPKCGSCHEIINKALYEARLADINGTVKK